MLEQFLDYDDTLNSVVLFTDVSTNTEFHVEHGLIKFADHHQWVRIDSTTGLPELRMHNLEVHTILPAPYKNAEQNLCAGMAFDVPKAVNIHELA